MIDVPVLLVLDSVGRLLLFGRLVLRFVVSGEGGGELLVLMLVLMLVLGFVNVVEGLVWFAAVVFGIAAVELEPAAVGLEILEESVLHLVCHPLMVPWRPLDLLLCSFRLLLVELMRHHLRRVK